MSNYPPGVTGFEPQIAGFDTKDVEHDFDCPNCDYSGVTVATDQFESFEVFRITECPQCGEEDEHEVTDAYDPDPDIGREDD